SPSRALTIKTSLSVYSDGGMANTGSDNVGKTLRLIRAVSKSILPLPRPLRNTPELSNELLLAMAVDIQKTIAGLQLTDSTQFNATDQPLSLPDNLIIAANNTVLPQELEEPEVVTRISTSGGRHWGINLGSYNTRYEAEQILLKTALRELGTLDDALRKVVKSRRGYEANFVGMSQELAAFACRRLDARDMACAALGPS
ncbi:MAG: D-alanyl-D-alanine carboxypeptidase, partial [Paracoccaceae bacterium]